MDLVTIISILAIVIGIFTVPSSAADKIEKTLFSKLRGKQQISQVIDITEIKKKLG